jgi:hypothetical protein
LQIGVRGIYASDVMFVLSGVALRIARRMELHRDGASLNLSPFEAEMRRRLWWLIIQADFRLSDVINARPSLDLFATDVKTPLNIHDTELQPDMLELPTERKGITAVSMCRFRCDILDFMRRMSAGGDKSMHWESFGSSDLSLVEKDKIITQAEDHLESTYLRYCDPAEPLHLLLSVMIRSSLCRMRLHAHSPRRYTDKNIPVPQTERDTVFANASRLLEYVALVSNQPALHRYQWHLSSAFLWNTTLYMLIEARHRRLGPDIDRFWVTLGQVLSNYAQVFEHSTGGAMTVLSKWTLDVWDAYVDAMKDAEHGEPTVPKYIDTMRSRLDQVPKQFSMEETPAAVPEGGANPLPNVMRDVLGQRQASRELNASNEVEPFNWADFLNMPTFEINGDEWINWEHLITDEEGD